MAHSILEPSKVNKTAINSSIEELRSLLGSDVDVNFKNVNWRSPLHCAVRLKFEPGVDLLLDRGANVNSESSGETPLHIAAWKKNISIFEKLVERGADVNCQNKNGLSVLHIASILGSLPFVDILFRKGVDVNIKDVKGNTPLHFAAKSTSLEVVARLLYEGAILNCKNDAGQIPLHTAAKYCYQRPILKLLLSKGSEVNTKDKRGRTPLHLAAERASYSNEANINDLLEWGASPLAKDDDDEQPLDLASYKWVVINIFKKHSMKLMCARFNFDPIIDFETTDAYFMKCTDAYLMKCTEEVKRMKLFRSGQNLLSDIFDKYGDPTYLSNETLKYVVFSDLLKIEFPIYASFLEATYERARRRAALLNVAQYSLTDLLPVEIVRYILSFLSDDDIKNVLNTSNC
uniref:PRANC domain-containing protein n=1 Tax=Cuerna arida TaxID=1464854 RepID=A0A1B6GPY2_9HEMI